MPPVPAQPQSAITSFLGTPQPVQSPSMSPMISEGSGLPANPPTNSVLPPMERVASSPNYTIVPETQSLPAAPTLPQTPQSPEAPSVQVQSPVAATSHWASAMDQSNLPAHPNTVPEVAPAASVLPEITSPVPIAPQNSPYSYPGQRSEPFGQTPPNTAAAASLGSPTAMFAPVSGAVTELPVATAVAPSNSKTAVTLGVLAFTVGILAVVGGYYVLSASQDGRISQSNIPPVAVRSDMPTPQVQGNVSEDSLSNLSDGQGGGQSAVLSDSTTSDTPVITKEVLSADTKPKPPVKKRQPSDPLLFTGVEVLDGMKKYTNANAEFSFTAPSAWIQCKTKTPLQPELGMGWFDADGCPLPEETKEPMVLITFHSQSIDALSEKNMFSLTLEQLKAAANFDLYTTSEKSGSTKYYTYVTPLPTGGYLSVLIPSSVPKETRLSTIESFEVPK